MLQTTWNLLSDEEKIPYVLALKRLREQAITILGTQGKILPELPISLHKITP